MLLNLPSEILRSITNKLSFSDKLNLCKTCRGLHSQISKTNLYETVRVFKDTEGVVKIFYDKILDGTQVQYLDIAMDDLSDELYSNLADIFPNLIKIVTVRRVKGFDPFQEMRLREDHIVRPLLKWRYKLKKYDSYYDWIYFQTEIFRSVFPKLEELNFRNIATIPGRKSGFDPLFLSKGITNAPMLTTLDLINCDISIDSLEEIHKGCPYIYSLKFDHMMLVVDNYELPSPIAPADSVLYLKIHAICFDKHGLFPDYIVEKYPNLQDLDMYIFNSSPSRIETKFRVYYPVNMRAISGDSAEYHWIRRNRLEELSPTLYAYQNGAREFLSRLSNSIKSLSLQYNIFDDAIETLSKTNTALSILQLSDLEFGNDYIKADQLKYLKYLHSLRVLKVRMRSAIQSFNIDLISNTITELHISLLDKNFDIKWIFSMFPSLESLNVSSNFELLTEKVVTNLSHTKKMYPKLRKLDLRGCTFLLESLNCLKTLLPNLEEFCCNLYMNFEGEEKISHSIDLTCWNLTKIILGIRALLYIRSSYTGYIVLSTPKGTKRLLQTSFEQDSYPVQGEPEFVEGTVRINIACTVEPQNWNTPLSFF